MEEIEINNVGYYSIIPATILYNNELKANEKLLYAIITSLSNKEGYCFASNKYLAEKLERKKSKMYNLNGWVSGTPEGWDDLSAMSNELFQEINKTKKILGITPRKTYKRK